MTTGKLKMETKFQRENLFFFKEWKENEIYMFKNQNLHNIYIS